MIYSKNFLLKPTRTLFKKDDITIVITFSRLWCVDLFFKKFYKIKFNKTFNPHRFHLLIYDNTESIDLQRSLLEHLAPINSKFQSITYYKSYRRTGDLRTGEIQTDVMRSKLPFIFAMHLDFVQLIKTDKFVLLEDDTLMPDNCVIKLLTILSKNKRCGVATAIATGRSPYRTTKTRLGVHYIKRRGDFIYTRYTPLPMKKGIVEVDACGWYCCASYTKLWKDGFKGMKKYFKKIPRFALDNFHTNNIKRKGFKILADFSLRCEHMNLSGGRVLYWTIDDAMPMLDEWLPKWNNYAQGVILTNLHNSTIKRIFQNYARPVKDA